MKIYLKELKNYVDLKNININNIVNAFTMLGYEVESINHIVNQINLKIGKILLVEKHPKADKLNIVKLSIDNKKYQIICGAENVVDAKYVVVVLPGEIINGMKIEERTLRGELSQGMICSLSEIGISKELLSEEENDGIISLEEITELNALAHLHLDDVVIELSILKNRYSSLSYISLAKELAWKLGVNYIIEKHRVNVSNSSGAKLSVSEGVISYRLIKMKIAEIKESSWEIKSVLFAAGIKSVNNLVDIGNYVSLILKQPIHIFDASFGDKINIKKVPAQFTSLNGTKYDLSKKVLAIVNEEKEIAAVAGVIGSKKYEVTKDTKEVYVESAVFEKSEIENSEKVLNISNHSSSLFKKDLTNINVDNALNLLTQLVSDKGIISSTSKPLSFDITKPKDKVINIGIKKLESYLGVKIEQQEIIDVLSLKDHRFINNKDGILSFSISQEEVFINSEVALIEEFIRIYGVENINPIISKELMHINYINRKEEKLIELRNQLKNFGMNEVITYSLTKQDINDIYNPFNYKGSVKLDKEYTLLNNEMRFSLIPSLIDISNINRRHKKNISSLFEISDIYSLNNKNTHVGILVHKGYIESILDPQQTIGNDIYIMRMFVEKIKDIFSPDIEFTYSSIKTNMTLLQETKILHGKNLIGFIGNNLNNEEFVLELDIDYLINSKKNKFQFESIGITNINHFDYTMKISNISKLKRISSNIEKVPNVIKVEINNIYQEKTFTIKVYCQNKNRTLSAKENKIINEKILSIIN